MGITGLQLPGSLNPVIKLVVKKHFKNMKNNLLRQLIMLSKCTFYGIFAQLLLFGVLVASDLNAQKIKPVSEVTIKLKVTSGTLGEIFSQIESSSGYTFSYFKSEIKQNQHLDLKKHFSRNLKDILLEISWKTNLAFYQVNDVINVRLKSETDQFVNADVKEIILANPIIITGKVISMDDGQPLPGVNIIIKGTIHGTVTDENGTYRLEAPSQSGTGTSSKEIILVFSSVGYISEEIAVGNHTVIDMALAPDITALEEIVVVGFGTQKKASVIGSVDRIEPTQLKQPTRTLSTSLAGRLAGVVAVQNSGEPGHDGANFWIRGVNTFTGNTNPLILVDGVERDLDNVDPEEIADFTILKDATATAVYGVRGANGVVLITTKKGAISAPQVHLRMEAGLSSPLELPSFVNGPTYMRMQNEALRNIGKNALYSDEEIERTASGFDPYSYPNVNWMDELIDQWTPSERITLNVSGGSERVRYFVSGAFLNQSGMWKKFGGTSYNNNINLKRYNFRSNVDMEVTNSTTFSVHLAAILDDRNYPGVPTGDIFRWMTEVPPTWFPMTYPDNNKVPGYPYLMARNPYQLLARSGYSTENHSTVQSNFTINQDLSFVANGLSARALFAFDAYTRAIIRRALRPRPYLIIPFGFDEEGNPILKDDNGNYNYQDQEPNNADYYNYLTRTVENPYTDRSIYLEASLNYIRNFGRHTIGGLLLYNQSDKTYPSRTGIYESVPERYQGLAGRATYAFDDKYFAEFNFGYNGSETFASGERYGFFPSYAIGWVPSKEPFMAFMKPAIEYMKFRLSHGVVGNDGLNSRFVYLTRVENTSTNVGFGTNNGFGYGSGAGINITYYGNPDATWEKATKTDLGLELRFLKNFMLQADVFYEKRTDIWVELSRIPDIFGFSTNPYANAGEMENKGADAFLEYTKQFKNDFSINFKGTFTYSTNKIVASGEETKKYAYQSRMGQPFAREMGYIAEGLFIDQAEIDNSPSQTTLGGESMPGDIKYKDVNRDGIIDDFDRVYMGNPTIPEITYGFGSGLVYKNFDLSMLFQGATNVSFFANPKAFPEEDRGNVLTIMEGNHWNEETQNLSAVFPRLGIGDQSKNYTNSSYWLKDGSYIRLKQIELGYSLPRNLTQKYKIGSARIYANGLNLLTFSPFKWWDAESQDSDGIYYPIQKVINAGLEIKF